VKNTYRVEGGVGKAIAFSALTKLLKDKDGEKIQIYTPYIEVFIDNPDVSLVIDQGTVSIEDPKIMESDNIIFCEPYKGNFAKGNQHLIESFCELLDVEYSSDLKPCIYNTLEDSVGAEALKDAKVDGDYIVVQFTGGQSPLGFIETAAYSNGDPGRSYPPFLAQSFVNLFKQSYPDVIIIGYGLPNEMQLEGVTYLKIPYIAYKTLTAGAKAAVTIDSSLGHIVAATETPSVSLWGSTRPSCFGYKEKKMFNGSSESFNQHDPRNIMVDPSALLDEVKKLIDAVKAAHPKT